MTATGWLNIIIFFISAMKFSNFSTEIFTVDYDKIFVGDALLNSKLNLSKLKKKGTFENL